MKAALALSALSATAVVAYQHDTGRPHDIPARPLPGAVALHHATQPLFDISGRATPLTLNHSGGNDRATLYGLDENRPWFVPEQPLALAADYTATSRVVSRDPTFHCASASTTATGPSARPTAAGATVSTSRSIR